MSLDTKYRPTRFEHVLGQEGTIKVLRSLVATGRGFRQSYVFFGAYGGGKTTLARILARALLCSSPVDGDPCDQCLSCRAVLSGQSFDFIEVDAATNSGKADVRKITEDADYTSFSGKRRVYILDEAHQLTTGALDNLLKSLEETIPGTEDKKLVCIFCTTEPEKMRATVLSRCAPAFRVQTLPPEVIAERLRYVCEQENLLFEQDQLVLLASITECHIRDALKALEGVASLGAITKQTVATYLHLDLNETYLTLLEALGKDLPKAIQDLDRLLSQVSPLTCYEKLADLSLLAYRTTLGQEKLPPHWDYARVSALGNARQTDLLRYAEKFSSRPGKPIAAMLACDIAALHHGEKLPAPIAQALFSNPPVSVNPPVLASLSAPPSTENKKVLSPVVSNGTLTTGKYIVDSVEVNQRAVRPSSQDIRPQDTRKSTLELTTAEFCRILGQCIAEQGEAERHSGSAGRSYLDRN